MTVYVDNTDTSQIDYQSTYGLPWIFLETQGNPKIRNESLSAIEGLGSVVFQFTGSHVDVYGTEMLPQNGATVVSSYTLDQQTPIMHTSNASWVAEEDGINFYSSENLSYGDHVLVISVVQASTSAPYYLDYISYSTSVSSSSSSSSSSLSSSSSSSSSVSSSSTSSTAAMTSVTDTGLPTISITPVVEKSNHVNAIVGGVIGGAVGLIAIILAIFFFCFGRRVLQRYTARKKDLQSELPTEAMDVTPYIASDLGSSPHMIEARSGERPSLYPHEATRSSFTLAPEDSASQAGGLGALINSPSGPRLSASRKSGVPPPVASQPPATHHADSGLRFRPEATPSEVAPIDVPPVYTPN